MQLLGLSDEGDISGSGFQGSMYEKNLLILGREIVSWVAQHHGER